MSDTVLRMDSVYKRFNRGEIHDCLRDLIPGAFSRLLGRNRNPALKDYQFWALNDVSFEVNKGEALGIIGTNGAGKSTLLKLLCGIMKPTQGNINVAGTLSALVEVGAGFHPDLTGRENIYLNGTILGMRREQIRSRFDAIVEFSGLADFIDTPVKRYSSGMYARLGFSVAAHVDPDILIVDEVLSVGDYVFQQKCLDRMRNVLSSGATVVFVSHNLKAVSDLCKRAILLNRGMIVMDGPALDVIDRYYENGVTHQTCDTEKDVSILGARMVGSSGEQLQFDAGSKAILEVDVSGNADLDRLSVAISIQDDNHYDIFDTSSERLSGASFSLRKGEKKTFAVALQLNLGEGAYRISISIYRYDIQKMYDDLSPKKAFFVRATEGARGVANLYPKLLDAM